MKLIPIALIFVVLQTHAQKPVAFEDFTTRNTVAQRSVIGMRWMNGGQFYTSSVDNRIVTSCGNQFSQVLTSEEASHRKRRFQQQREQNHDPEQGALQDGLIRPRGKFDLFYCPDKPHGISGAKTRHLYTMTADFVRREPVARGIPSNQHERPREGGDLANRPIQGNFVV